MGLPTLQVKSGSGSCNEIWIFHPFSKAVEKTWSCFALDTEHQYWTVTVQYLCRVKKNSMTSNVLPLHFTLARPAQAKIQMLATFSQIVTILLKSLLKSLGLYMSLVECLFLIDVNPENHMFLRPKVLTNKLHTEYLSRCSRN